jgi:hypothetical protein
MRDVMVNVLANVIAAGVIYLLGAAYGFFPHTPQSLLGVGGGLLFVIGSIGVSNGRIQEPNRFLAKPVWALVAIAGALMVLWAQPFHSNRLRVVLACIMISGGIVHPIMLIKWRIKQERIRRSPTTQMAGAGQPQAKTGVERPAQRQRPKSKRR